jgi:hypothetical protein
MALPIEDYALIGDCATAALVGLFHSDKPAEQRSEDRS